MGGAAAWRRALPGRAEQVGVSIPCWVVNVEAATAQVVGDYHARVAGNGPYLKFFL